MARWRGTDGRRTVSGGPWHADGRRTQDSETDDWSTSSSDVPSSGVDSRLLPRLRHLRVRYLRPAPRRVGARPRLPRTRLRHHGDLASVGSHEATAALGSADRVGARTPSGGSRNCRPAGLPPRSPAPIGSGRIRRPSAGIRSPRTPSSGSRPGRWAALPALQSIGPSVPEPTEFPGPSGRIGRTAADAARRNAPKRAAVAPGARPLGAAPGAACTRALEGAIPDHRLFLSPQGTALRGNSELPRPAACSASQHRQAAGTAAPARRHGCATGRTDGGQGTAAAFSRPTPSVTWLTIRRLGRTRCRALPRSR